MSTIILINCNQKTIRVITLYCKQMSAQVISPLSTNWQELVLPAEWYINLKPLLATECLHPIELKVGECSNDVYKLHTPTLSRSQSHKPLALPAPTVSAPKLLSSPTHSTASSSSKGKAIAHGLHPPSLAFVDIASISYDVHLSHVDSSD